MHRVDFEELVAIIQWVASVAFLTLCHVWIVFLVGYWIGAVLAALWCSKYGLVDNPQSGYVP